MGARDRSSRAAELVSWGTRRREDDVGRGDMTVFRRLAGCLQAHVPTMRVAGLTKFGVSCQYLTLSSI